MRKIITILSTCLLAACFLYLILQKEPEYNIQNDSFVISHLKLSPILAKKVKHDDVIYYTFRYEDCEFHIFHTLFTPYKHVESWNYYCITIEGKMVILQSSCDIWQHKCSLKTYELLQNYCKTIN